MLKPHELAEVVDAIAPGQTIRHKQKIRIIALLSTNAADVAEHVGLFAAGCSVGLRLDQD
jgi:hypothetical protein